MEKAEVKKTVAAIDSDFLNHLLDIKNSKDVVDLIRRFFNALEVTVTMHPLVYKNEVQFAPRKNIRDRLIEDSIISITEKDRFLGERKRYYFMQVREIYKDYMNEEYPCPLDENSWVSGKSLGEVHTVVMCHILSYLCFLSDDKGAKQLQNIVNERYLHPFTVYNRKDGCNIIKSNGKTKEEMLNVKELNWIAHS